MSDAPLRIAMWSGPRNISTAMMRAWENRPDTAVWDEPFYAYYLAATGLAHPMAADVIAAGETDWRKVVAAALGPVPDGRRIFYQKHMTHHQLPEIDPAWLDGVANCFLIRDPREVLASYAAKRTEVTLDDIGMHQQAQIFDAVVDRTGRIPPVLDARDVLQDPARLLSLLCSALDVPFTEAMLSWPPGRRDSDGVWAEHWYAAVESSTSFAPYRPREPELDETLEALAEASLPHYQRLYAHRLGA